MSLPIQRKYENYEHSGLKLCYIKSDRDGQIGIHLSRTVNDPYPWISGVLKSSPAELAGVKVGDCVLEVNGEDVLGQKIAQVAEKVRGNWIRSESEENGVNQVYTSLLLWNAGTENHNVNTQSFTRLAMCIQNIAQLLECPVCFEVSHPPISQCVNGHILCDKCRVKTSRCPICRIPLARGRCLIGEKLFILLASTCKVDDSHGNSSALNFITLNKRLESPSEFYKDNIKDMNSMIVYQPKYHCPTGSPCNPLKDNSSLLVHMQKAHQMPSKQYYGSVSEKVIVEFSEKSIASIILSDVDEVNQFFIVRFRCLENLKLGMFWVWYFGEFKDKYDVEFINSDAKVKWKGKPHSLIKSFQDIVKNKKYVLLNYDIDYLGVKINIKRK